MKSLIISVFLFLHPCFMIAQNSMVGDGFGGRKWYKPYNYMVGSYSAYTICGDEKQLYAWGANQSGQLGDGTYNATTLPVKVLNMTNVKYYSTGYVMGAIKDDSSGWVWGDPNQNNNTTTPQKVLDRVIFVDAGVANCAFVKSDGTVWSVGSNYFGEFGNGNQIDPYSQIPKKMNNINTAVRTAQGYHSTTVLLKNGTVFIAGKYNGITYTTPTLVNINAFIVDIKANLLETIAIDSSGSVWYWDNYSLPIKLNGVGNIVAISGCNDGDHFFLLDENHDCYAFGDNYDYQCGLATPSLISSPIKVSTDVNDIMAGETFSYIVKTNGK